MPEQHITLDQRSDIFRGWSRGLGPEVLASTYGITVAKVIEIVDAEMERRPLPSELDPQELLREHWVRLMALMEDYAMIATRETGLARVRAIDGRFAVLRHLFEMHQKLGLLPREPEAMAAQISGVRLGNHVIDILEEHDLPDEVWAPLKRRLRQFNERIRAGLPPEPDGQSPYVEGMPSIE